MTEVSSGNREPLYTAEQIKIPPELPDILKNYTKHIIRTQPGDIISSSAEYFGRLAKQKTQLGKRLTTMQLETFYNKFVRIDKVMVTKKDVEDACAQASVPITQMNDIIKLGNWAGEKIPWLKFWALLVASASGTLAATIEQVCLLLGDDGKVTTSPLIEIIQFLTERDPNSDPAKTELMLKSLRESGTLPVEVVIDLLKKSAAQSRAATSE
ncbi:Ropporin-1-like protein [Blyttiomyces sp. JEL0837]|nr:Ropporin-1-like protein [Blyttiomyces sp. JEL0837]